MEEEKMNGKTIVLGLVALVGIVALLYAVGHAEGATIVVPDDYATIHEAVENASSGDTVYVKAGTYTDWADIEVSLTLQGASYTNTTFILNSTGLQSNTIFIDAVDDVLITGFSLIDASGDAAIFSGNDVGFSSNIIVEDCYFDNNGDGIAVYNVSDFVVRNCTFYNSTSGWDDAHIVMENCENILIEHNYFGGQSNYPVDFYNFYGVVGEYRSYNATVQYNTFEDTGGIGLGLYDANNTRILYNNFTNTTHDAIGVYGHNVNDFTAGVLIQGNIFENCGTENLGPSGLRSAITLYYANYVNITENYFYNNTGFLGDDGNTTAIELDTYVGNTSIWYNNFDNNENHILFTGSPDIFNVTFDNGTYGNYWDNYTGVDANSDGIGDTPHPVGATLEDNYPLMDPMTITYPVEEAAPGMFDEVMDMLIEILMLIAFVFVFAYLFKSLGSGMMKSLKK